MLLEILNSIRNTGKRRESIPEIVKNVTAETLLKETVKKVRRGSIVYTDKWNGYDSPMFSGYKHLNIDHR